MPTRATTPVQRARRRRLAQSLRAWHLSLHLSSAACGERETGGGEQERGERSHDVSLSRVWRWRSKHLRGGLANVLHPSRTAEKYRARQGQILSSRILSIRPP